MSDRADVTFVVGAAAWVAGLVLATGLVPDRRWFLGCRPYGWSGSASLGEVGQVTWDAPPHGGCGVVVGKGRTGGGVQEGIRVDVSA